MQVMMKLDDVVKSFKSCSVPHVISTKFGLLSGITRVAQPVCQPGYTRCVGIGIVNPSLVNERIQIVSCSTPAMRIASRPTGDAGGPVAVALPDVPILTVISVPDAGCAELLAPRDCEQLESLVVGVPSCRVYHVTLLLSLYLTRLGRFTCRHDVGTMTLECT